MIYLDYAASTPVDQNVLDVFYQNSLQYYANPNAIHPLGRQAFNIIDQSTQKIAHYLHVLPEEIIYTSGATEANNLAIKGICQRYKNRGRHILVGRLEHSSLLASATAMQELGFEVEVIPLDCHGIIDIDALRELLRDDTILVSLCAVDSELGIRQPVEKIGEFLKNHTHCYFHVDASQAIGKTMIDFQNIDLVTLAPHKFYGMNGFGALIKKKQVSLMPIIHGGKSTTIYRSGTPVTAQVVALDKALEIVYDQYQNRLSYVQHIHDKFVQQLSLCDNVHLNTNKYCLPHYINISVRHIKANAIVQRLADHGIYVSAKTSCCPTETPSQLVYALTHDKSLASSAIRISLSHLTTEKEIQAFIDVFQQILKG